MNVFITGASSGIGEALANAYVRRYASSHLVIGLLARNEQKLLSFKQSILSNFPNVKIQTYCVDVREAESLQQAANVHINAFGVPNVVIANAGVSTATYTQDANDIDAFKAVFSINVFGVVQTFQPFIQPMEKVSANQSVQLVGIASVAGIRGLPGASAYSASKAAVIAYMESLRVEMSLIGIDVTTIAPGYIKTPMTDINTYPMPFLMAADKAADLFIQAIEKKKKYVVIPWQMGWVAKLLRLMPIWLWDWLAKKAPHKSKVDVD